MGHRIRAPEPSTGLLICNLGSPDSPTSSGVRRFLAEFLADPRVVDLPRIPWWLLLHGLILPLRCRRVAREYAKIWTPEGSPLTAITRRLSAGIATELEQSEISVQLLPAMCYGKPGLAEALENFRRAGIRRLLVLPLFPQYSATTTAALYDAVNRELRHWQALPELRFILRYHAHPDYISALTESIRVERGPKEAHRHLLFSFHGIPERYARVGDPYANECNATAKAVVGALGLPDDHWALSYQSRFGREPWLGPDTVATLTEWARKGVRNVDVVCPGFAADCLETLREIAHDAQADFLAAGGLSFRYIAALNDQPAHARALARVVRHHLSPNPRSNDEQTLSNATGHIEGKPDL